MDFCVFSWIVFNLIVCLIVILGELAAETHTYTFMKLRAPKSSVPSRRPSESPHPQITSSESKISAEYQLALKLPSPPSHPIRNITDTIIPAQYIPTIPTTSLILSDLSCTAMDPVMSENKPAASKILLDNIEDPKLVENYNPREDECPPASDPLDREDVFVDIESLTLGESNETYNMISDNLQSLRKVHKCGMDPSSDSQIATCTKCSIYLWIQNRSKEEEYTFYSGISPKGLFEQMIFEQMIRDLHGEWNCLADIQIWMWVLCFSNLAYKNWPRNATAWQKLPTELAQPSVLQTIRSRHTHRIGVIPEMNYFWDELCECFERGKLIEIVMLQIAKCFVGAHSKSRTGGFVSRYASFKYRVYQFEQKALEVTNSFEKNRKWLKIPIFESCLFALSCLVRCVDFVKNDLDRFVSENLRFQMRDL